MIDETPNYTDSQIKSIFLIHRIAEFFKHVLSVIYGAGTIVLFLLDYGVNDTLIAFGICTAIFIGCYIYIDSKCYKYLEPIRYLRTLKKLEKVLNTTHIELMQTKSTVYSEMEKLDSMQKDIKVRLHIVDK